MNSGHSEFIQFIKLIQYMLNHVLNDAQIIAGIDYLKKKNPCYYHLDKCIAQNQKPLIILCTHYLAVTDEQKWQVFLKYVSTLGLVIDHQFYIDLSEIHKALFGRCSDEDLLLLKATFGEPINSFRDNQLFELFFFYAKSAPYLDDSNESRLQELSFRLTPENTDNRSTQVAGLLFRRFYLQYTNHNYQNNCLSVIRNGSISQTSQIPVFEKIVNLMVQHTDFVEYLSNNTSLMTGFSRIEDALQSFIKSNTDLSHLVYMVYDLLFKVTDGEFDSTLLLKHISLQVLDPFIHPLALSIFDFYEQIFENEEGEDKMDQKRFLPKITFLNMDGYDFEFNWKLLNSYQDSCQYISLIDEMIESKTDESLIFDMVTRDQEAFSMAKNSYIIPIRNNHNHKSLNDMHFRHILDEFVYPLIRSFQPQIIMFSYSFAYFNQESDIRLSSKLFTEISTQLCLISNYRVIFLPRLLSSGIQIQDHRFEKELLKTDHKNILYYLSNYSNAIQQSYKFLHGTMVNRIAKYADNSMKIVKSNSFYEKLRDDKFTYKLNMEKVRYMNEILSGFLESCKNTYLQEVKDKGKRMQDPNLQCYDLIDYKLLYCQMLNKLHSIHQNHFYNQIFKPNVYQIHTYRLLSMQHQRTQKREDSQFVSFLAQDLKDYLYIVRSIDQNQPQLVQIYLRHLKSPVYIHSKLTQYFVNYQAKRIVLINVLSFKDIRELVIDSYQTCLVNYEEYLNQNEPTQHIWTEVSIVHETSEPVFFRSICFDSLRNNIYFIYGKDAKSNTMKDAIDVYNFDQNSLHTIYRERALSCSEFARAYASSLVFSFDQNSPKVTEIWTFGGSFLGQNQQTYCNMVEKIKIEDGCFRSQKIPKETIIPHSMRPMYGALMLSIEDQMEKAILIIGGTQNELLVNVHEYQGWAYKFQQVDNAHIVTKIKALDVNNRKPSPITFFSSSHNIYVHNDKMYLVSDGTQILGKSYRVIKNPVDKRDEFELVEPYSPYGFVSITSIKLICGQICEEHILRRKILMRHYDLQIQNTIEDRNQVYQPFAQMHKNMKFYYKEVVNIDYHTKILFQDSDDIVALIKNYDKIKHINLQFNLKEEENQREEFIKPCSLCFCQKNKSLYILTCQIENDCAYLFVFQYPVEQLTQDISLSLSQNNTKLVVSVYAIFAKVFLHLDHRIQSIRKQITCDNEAIYIIGGHISLQLELPDLYKILSQKNTAANNGLNQNFRIPLDTPESYAVHGEPNSFMYQDPLILWKQNVKIVIIEKKFVMKSSGEYFDASPEFKVWATKFEIQHKDSSQWNQGILVLPSFLMKNCPQLITSQKVSQKLIEQIQSRKLDSFLSNENSEFTTVVKIIDYSTIDSQIILIVAIQISNFIQILKLEFSFENKEEYLFKNKYGQQNHHKVCSSKLNCQNLLVPYVTLLTTTSNIDIIHGYRIFEPINEFSNLISSVEQKHQIIVQFQEQIVVYNLQQQQQ